MVVDLIATYWLEGLPSDSFWIAFPILALIILSVSLFAAVLRRLAGPVVIFITVIVVPTLVLEDLGPFLRPRNAHLLLRNTLYFDGHGIGQPLTVLLAYAVIAGVLLFVFDWFIDRPEPSVPGVEDANSAAVLAPVGPPP